MTVSRSFDAAYWNALANDPSIRPFVGGDQPLDFAEAVANPANVFLQADHGGWFFHPLLPSAYEVHTMFLPEGRGRKHLTAAAHGFRFMFTQTDCLEILTKCPDDNGPARWASSFLGFRERFHRPEAWGAGVGVSYRAFSVDDWMARDAECLAEGRRFHAALEAAKLREGSELAVHPEDPAHDRAVGAAALMVRAGNAGKGVGLYNRWAMFAGYQTIELLSDTVIDVRDAIVELRPDGSLGAMVRGVSPG